MTQREMGSLPESAWFHTEDLALTTFLTVEGFRPRMVRDDDTCVFVFRRDARLAELVALYEDDDARVEPRQFFRTSSVVRKRMSDFLGRL